ncbi:hypothetical protein L3Q82_014035 [Scortum barcoo]|uniref:Uncharacterized protein n=1 Tax=Scortum barcoo TaxID=214431 RepID=A0ACB8VW65_9TELE|nr:hypothetical protein L3Q82_014035 [Scortum barcoo]
MGPHQRHTGLARPITRFTDQSRCVTFKCAGLETAEELMLPVLGGHVYVLHTGLDQWRVVIPRKRSQRPTWPRTVKTMWCFSPQRRCLHSAVCLMKKLKGKTAAEQRWIQRQLRDPYVKASHQLNFRCRSAFKLLEMDDRFKLLQPGHSVVDCGAAPGAWSQVAVQRVNSAGTGETGGTGEAEVGGQVRQVKLGQVTLGGQEGQERLQGQVIQEGRGRLEGQVRQEGRGRLEGQMAHAGQVRLGGQVRHEGQERHSETGGTNSELPRGTVVGIDLLNIPPLDGAHFLSSHDVTDPATHAKLRELLPGGRAHVILSDMAPNASGFREMDHERLIAMCLSLLDLAEKTLQPGGSLVCKYWDGILAHKLQEKLSSVFGSVRTLKPDASRKDSAERYFYARIGEVTGNEGREREVYGTINGAAVL